MKDVEVSYKNYNKNIIEEIKIGLFDNVEMKIARSENDLVNVSMYDIISENIEVEGGLDLEKLNTIVKAFNLIKKQIEMEKEDEE